MYPHYVYVLKNTATGKCYVGCTKAPKTRLQAHFQCMRRGAHSVERMNEDFKRYGENSFVYTIIGKHDKTKALQIEAFYSAVLRTKDPRYGYNYKDQKGTGTMYVADKWRTVGYDHYGKRLYHYLNHNKIIEPEFTPEACNG